MSTGVALWYPPPLSAYSSYDLAIILLVSSHLLFSLAAACFVLHFNLRSSSSSNCCAPSTAAVTSPSLRRRLLLLLRLNSLWPVRLLLVLFASLLSFSELFRLPLNRPSLCTAYALSSQSFAEPAFFATLLFLLRASVTPKPSSSSSFFRALSSALLAALPFLILHSLFHYLSPLLLRKLSLPTDFLSSTVRAPSGRCTQPLYGTVLLALLGAIYVPMFISACWSAVTVVINKKLRIRLYFLASALVAALSLQVMSLALASLWNPSCNVAQALGMVSYLAVLVCVAVGEGILVVQPIVDALAIVESDTMTVVAISTASTPRGLELGDILEV